MVFLGTLVNSLFCFMFFIHVFQLSLSDDLKYKCFLITKIEMGKVLKTSIQLYAYIAFKNTWENVLNVRPTITYVWISGNLCP